MADLLIEAAVGDTEFDQRHQAHWLVSTDPDTVYFFYLQSRVLGYKKWTTGGGLGAFTRVISTYGSLSAFDVYYDKWTKGITTTRIHVVALEHSAQRFVYRNLDVSSDTLGTQVDIASGMSFDTEDLNSGFNQRHVSVTTAENGNVYALYRSQAVAASSGFFRSTDNGGTFSSRTNPIEAGSSSDRAGLFPAHDADGADIRCIYYDNSGQEFSVKTYDDSANTWGNETSIQVYGIGGTNYDIAVSQLHSSGDAYFCSLDDNAGSVFDGALWRISGPTSVTQLTDFFSNDGNGWYQTLTIDQTNDDLYAWWITGSLFSNVDIFYKKSTDLGATWGSAVHFCQDANGDFRGIGAPASIGADGGELTAAWFAEDDQDIFSNFVNSINIPAAGGGVTHSGAASLSGAATIGLAALLKAAGAAALAGAGTIVALANPKDQATAALAGAATTAMGARARRGGAITLAGVTALAGVPSGTELGEAALSGTAALSPASHTTHAGSAALATSGAVAFMDHVLRMADAALQGSGALTPAAWVTYRAESSLNGAAELAAVAAGATVQQGAAELNAAATLAATVLLTQHAAGAFAGAGNMISGAGMRRLVDLSLAAAAGLSSDPGVRRQVTVTLLVAALLNSDARMTLGASALLEAGSTLEATADAGNEAVMIGTATLAASAEVRFDHAGQAFEYRRKMQAREDHRLQQEKAMAGNAAMREQLQRDWDPLRHWDGWDPVRRIEEVRR